jgi:hypothetical protein
MIDKINNMLLIRFRFDMFNYKIVDIIEKRYIYIYFNFLYNLKKILYYKKNSVYIQNRERRMDNSHLDSLFLIWIIRIICLLFGKLELFYFIKKYYNDYVMKCIYHSNLQGLCKFSLGT